MEKFYYNDSEVRGFVEESGTYMRFPTEQEYHEMVKEEEDAQDNDR